MVDEILLQRAFPSDSAISDGSAALGEYGYKGQILNKTFSDSLAAYKALELQAT